jgi:hypothetical protein
LNPNIRYRFRNRKTGEEIETILELREVELQGFVPNPFQSLDWEILSRDLGTGMKDKNGEEIFEKARVRILYKSPVEATIEFLGGCFTLSTETSDDCLSAFSQEDIEIIGRAED